MPRFEYEVTSVDDKQSNVNAHMREQEEMGWTLISGTAVAYSVTDVRLHVWHTKYIMYWQRP